jgi:hypothetical protein
MSPKRTGQSVKIARSVAARRGHSVGSQRALLCSEIIFDTFDVKSLCGGHADVVVDHLVGQLCTVEQDYGCLYRRSV